MTEHKYPIAGRENDDCGGEPDYPCRYEHLHFEAGWQIMDGKTALKYVRSRNAQGEEGTDFSRNLRQQKVIAALKNKLSSIEVFFNPAKVQGLIEIGKKYLQSDPKLNDQELGSFANIIYRFISNKSEIRTLTLDTGSPESPGFLTHPEISKEYGNQWVLIPASGNWREFQNYFKQKIKNGY